MPAAHREVAVQPTARLVSGEIVDVDLRPSLGSTRAVLYVSQARERLAAALGSSYGRVRLLAVGGDVALDDMHDLPAEFQVVLLRVDPLWERRAEDHLAACAGFSLRRLAGQSVLDCSWPREPRLTRLPESIG